MTHSAHGGHVARLLQAGSEITTAGQPWPAMPAWPASEEISDQVSHRTSRGTWVPIASGLAAVIAISGVNTRPGRHGRHRGAGRGPGPGVVAVRPAVSRSRGSSPRAPGSPSPCSARVWPSQPDLAGSVPTGPDYTGSGRTPGGPFWGVDGTAAAADHRRPRARDRREAALLGVAPAARILSVRVSLESSDPLRSDQAVAGRLPDAIADGIIYAVRHGARIIDLPLDPAPRASPARPARPRRRPSGRR